MEQHNDCESTRKDLNWQGFSNRTMLLRERERGGGGGGGGGGGEEEEEEEEEEERESLPLSQPSTTHPLTHNHQPTHQLQPTFVLRAAPAELHIIPHWQQEFQAKLQHYQANKRMHPAGARSPSTTPQGISTEVSEATQRTLHLLGSTLPQTGTSPD